jgi:hypothetical protein
MFAPSQVLFPTDESKINSSAQLQALCLTSKVCSKIATPRLYENITLSVLNDKELVRFEDCLNSGALRNLDATRSLTFVSSRLPEPQEVQVGERTYIPPNVHVLRMEQLSTRHLLEKFPTNRLRSFRYVHSLRFCKIYISVRWRCIRSRRLIQSRWLSETPIDAETMRSLCQRQASTLWHVHATIMDPQVFRLLESIRTIDLWFPRVPDVPLEPLTGVLSRLSAFNDLERLFIGTSDDETGEVGDHLVRCLSSPTENLGKLKACREMSFYGVSVGAPLHQGLAKSVDFDCLTHLTLWRCFATEEFLACLVGARDAPGLSLKHLAISLAVDTHPQSDRTLLLLLGYCPKLTSLCLEWNSELGWRSDFLQSLDTIGENLRILSLHNQGGYYDHHEMTDDTLAPQEFKRICTACPNLEQLGYTISDRYLVTQWSGVFYLNLVSFLLTLSVFQLIISQEPVMQLKKLKTLHLRQNFQEPFEEPDDNVDVPAIIHRFAASFYKHLDKHSACPDFENLIIGRENKRNVGSLVYAARLTAAHCFQKGTLIDLHGARRVIPYLIRLSEFRSTSRYTEVLDWDSAWRSGKDWMWRIPGRFHD